MSDKDDCISRQAAIKAAREELESGTYFDIPSKIESLPAAQPERKPGRWKEHIFEGIMGGRPRALMCTKCNVISIYASNFCPNCGADMRKENES